MSPTRYADTRARPSRLPRPVRRTRPPAARRLTLFLSHGKSLGWWRESGILSRELLLYLHFLRTGVFDEVGVFSYDAADRQLVADMARQDPACARLTVLAPPMGRASGLAAMVWALFGPLLHRRRLRESLALKTNQINSGLAPFVGVLLSGRPLVFRFGYLLSRNYAKAGGGARVLMARAMEWLGYRTAHRIVVSATDIAQMLQTDPVTAHKTVLAPTYVDVSAFRAKTEYRFDEPVVAVGRFSKPKNLANLIRGAELAGRDLILFGAGPLETELRALAETVSIRVIFAGQVANEELPRRLRSHTVYAIPSLYEGLPKALVEAMACGMICVGSDVPGVRDLIEDGRTGYLIQGFEPQDIADALTRAFEARDEAVGRAARARVADVFSLERYAAREAEIYQSIRVGTSEVRSNV